MQDHQPTPPTHDNPSPSAMRVAIARAAHQLLDEPIVLADPFALRVLGQETERMVRDDPYQHNDPISRTMRAAVVARSRWAEDRVAQAVSRGVTQYLVLGAGLDTFALRAQGHGGLRIYEVDHPTTQRWKLATLAATGITAPASTVFVPADLETDSLAKRLREAGFRDDLPACVSWLGVSPYLSAQAVDATLQFIAGLTKGSGITFDYRVSLALLHPMEQVMEQYAANMFAAAGEPWRSAFDPSVLRSRLLAMGFSTVQDLGSAELNARYFVRRKDGLQSAGGGFRVAYAEL